MTLTSAFDGRGTYSLAQEITPMTDIQFSNEIDTSYRGPENPAMSRKPVGGKKDHITYVSAVDSDTSNVEKQEYTRRDTKLSRVSTFLRKNPVSSFGTPTFAAPWQHDATRQGLRSESESSRITVRAFDRRHQGRRLFTFLFLRYWITIAWGAVMSATLLGFSSTYMPQLTKLDKYGFNMLITVESLFFGIIVVAALKDYCKVMTWRFLAAKYRALQEFELVLDCSSLMATWKLLFAGRTAGSFGINGTQAMCLLSLIIFLGLQLVIGALGLTYSIDPTPGLFDFDAGDVFMADLSNIRQDLSNNTEVAGITGSANFYGVSGQMYTTYPDIPLGNGSFGLDSIYTADNNTYFYNMVEQAPYDPKNPTPVAASTKRYITANATCEALKVIEDPFSANLTGSYIVFERQDGTHYNWTIDALTTQTTTYAAEYLNYTCGTRCTSIYIIDTGSPADESANVSALHSQVFACKNEVSQIYNTNTCAQPYNCTLSDENAFYIAGAIGLSGALPADDTYQYRNYPPGSPYSWDGYTTEYWTSPASRAASIAQFSMQAIAAMDDVGFNMGAYISMPGQVPSIGSALNIKWAQTGIVLGCIAGIQLLCLLLALVYSNGALIKDGGALANARLLRPVIDRLGSHGCALTGDEVAESLGNFKVIYGVRKMPTSTIAQPGAIPAEWHAGLIQESEGYGEAAEEGKCPKATFPEGLYDGPGHFPNESDEDTCNEESTLLRL